MIFKVHLWNLMILLNILGSVIVLSSSSFISLWIGMELTTMTMPSLLSSMNSSLMSKINSWKYYMIQCYSSSMFFLVVLCMSFSSTSFLQGNMGWVMILVTMMVKMGIFPFQGWLFHISSSISWLNFLIVSTIQKIGPLTIISEATMSLSKDLSVEMILSSSFSVISIFGIVVNSIRYIMVVSSIINSMWMIAASQVSKTSFFSFMIFYFIHLLILFMFLKGENGNTLSELFFFSKDKFSIDSLKIICVFSMIGMPPLLGFFVKMSVVDQLIEQQQVFTSLVLTLVSSLIMLMYLKLLIMSSMSMQIQFYQKNKNLLIPISSLFVTLSLFYFLL